MPAFTGAEASATACLSHGRCFSLLPPSPKAFPSSGAPPQSLPPGGVAVLNDTPVACQIRGPTDPQGDRCPHIPAALAATYPLRCSAPQWARFDNRLSTSAPDPTLAQRQRQRRKRYKRSPEPTTSPAEPIPRSQHRQIRTCPPRAKGSLNRRFEWFSLVTFFLQKKKVTRAGARNSPACARRRNTDSPPQRRNPPRAKEVLKRSFKRLSLAAFFQR